MEMSFGGFLFLGLIGLVFCVVAYARGYARAVAGKKRFPWDKPMRTLPFVALALLLLPIAAAADWELTWNPVTLYTDGTTIEATKGVFYNVRMDNTVVLATRTSATRVVIPDNVIGHGVPHVFQAQAELSTGELSVWSAGYNWSSPLGTPTTPGGFQMRRL